MSTTPATAEHGQVEKNNDKEPSIHHGQPITDFLNTITHRETNVPFQPQSIFYDDITPIFSSRKTNISRTCRALRLDIRHQPIDKKQVKFSFKFQHPHNTNNNISVINTILPQFSSSSSHITYHLVKPRLPAIPSTHLMTNTNRRHSHLQRRASLLIHTQSFLPMNQMCNLKSVHNNEFRVVHFMIPLLKQRRLMIQPCIYDFNHRFVNDTNNSIAKFVQRDLKIIQDFLPFNAPLIK